MGKTAYLTEDEISTLESAVTHWREHWFQMREENPSAEIFNITYEEVERADAILGKFVLIEAKG